MNRDRIYQTLHRRFGYQKFRDGQLATIEAVLAGQDTLAVLPTGGGKSLLYQLPAYLTPGIVLVVSPLISLMQDQVDRLHRRGEKRVLLLSGQDKRAREQQLGRLGQAKFVFASPEILANPTVSTALRRVHVAILTIDEAHCISQWGPDFRPEYLLLRQLRELLDNPVTLMLTATAPPRVQADILAKLGLSREGVTLIRRSVNRENIFLAVEQLTSPDEKAPRLLQLVQALSGAGIVYFASRRLATMTAAWLQKQSGIAVAAYHAGMPAADRFRVQQQFMNNDLQLICATSAFGMGVDKADIRFIIHYHQPTNLADYVQEIGRAGRDGQQSAAILLASPGDGLLARQLTTIDLPPVSLLERVRQGELASAALGANHELFTFYFRQHYTVDQLVTAFNRRRQQNRWQLEQVQSYLSLDSCRRAFLLNYFGERPVDQDRCCDHESPDWLSQPLLPPRPLPSPQAGNDDWDQQLRGLLNLS
ncbi:RecQ family ATP-dependent DNA helicase [Limosilactobacillus antri]|uniref:ATP-dependent DNA helicase RecQ n=1 Tax=Limosilactobacillus antri DSM 16041 TaxID=525309 RepID=C8P855_9LACO|nr:RecQ family ATP-dependent DNA helicase [Limosilactobacillus antri]EEW53355.1 ATP-dependent DNA helicase, RecQ family [Limosilactobacillus antri DSM 16041]KRK59625.1 ATP-dependent helicase RecQ [Limosilactobacillus antri DSM 16041]